MPVPNKRPGPTCVTRGSPHPDFGTSARIANPSPSSHGFSKAAGWGDSLELLPRPKSHQVIRIEGTELARFLRAVAYASVLEKTVSLKWVQEQNLIVKGLSLGHAGMVDVDLGNQKEIERDTDAETKTLIVTFLQEYAKGSREALHFLAAQNRIRQSKLSALKERFRSAGRINSDLSNALESTVKTLENIHWVAGIALMSLGLVTGLTEAAAAAEEAATWGELAWTQLKELLGFVPLRGHESDAVSLIYGAVDKFIEEDNKPENRNQSSLHVVLLVYEQQAIKRLEEKSVEFGAKVLGKSIGDYLAKDREMLMKKAEDYSEELAISTIRSLAARSKKVASHFNRAAGQYRYHLRATMGAARTVIFKMNVVSAAANQGGKVAYFGCELVHAISEHHKTAHGTRKSQ